jgi:hypothetical protein
MLEVALLEMDDLAPERPVSRFLKISIYPFSVDRFDRTF